MPLPFKRVHVEGRIMKSYFYIRTTGKEKVFLRFTKKADTTFANIGVSLRDLRQTKNSVIAELR